MHTIFTRAFGIVSALDIFRHIRHYFWAFECRYMNVPLMRIQIITAVSSLGLQNTNLVNHVFCFLAFRSIQA
jgi:hypothetical protein